MSMRSKYHLDSFFDLWPVVTFAFVTALSWPSLKAEEWSRKKFGSQENSLSCLRRKDIICKLVGCIIYMGFDHSEIPFFLWCHSEIHATNPRKESCPKGFGVLGNPKTEIRAISDDQTPPATVSCPTPSVDLETMAALGISFVHSHNFRRYYGPPVLNSSDDPANWAALGNPYIH